MQRGRSVLLTPVGLSKAGNNALRFADVHCHILYGVDDGSRSKEMSLSMLKQAASEGVEAMILTPHFFVGHTALTKETLREKVQFLQGICREEGIPVELYPGTELYYTHDADRALEAHEVPTLNETNRLLVEFAPEIREVELLNAVKRMAGLGYVPVIAHLERYAAVSGSAEKVAYLRSQGAEVQINAATFAGEIGLGNRMKAERLLKEKQVDYVGTDAHDDRIRKPAVRQTLQRLYRKYEPSYIEEITYWNARSLMEA